jgi:pimeloyl-ACP methyl ester carboxylesterase
MPASERTFEDHRIKLFERYGPTPTPRRVRDRHGRETYVLDLGGDGPPLVMIHGGGSEASIWTPIAARFTDTHRVLVADRPGCGLSYRVAYGGFDCRAAAAAWLTDLVDGLDLGPVDILANSMGGFFSLAYTLTDGARVRRIALAGAPAGVDRWIPYPLRLMGLKGVNRLLFALQGEMDVDDVRDMFDDMLVADVERVDEQLLEVGARAGSLPGALVAWRTLLEECITPGGWRRRYLIRDEVAGLDLPTLMVWGEDDAFASPESGAELASRMPDARLVRVPDAGHLPWLDRPEAVVDPVREFLAADVGVG